ncbi:MAG: hypothetical protein ABID54_03940 [Pseudomonadota bacterium]
MFMETSSTEFQTFGRLLIYYVHMAINPVETAPKIMHSIKSFTTHEINKFSNRKDSLWQDEYSDRVRRNQRGFLEEINDSTHNLVKADLSEGYEDDKWAHIRK